MRKLDIGSGYRIIEGYEHLDALKLDHIEHVCDATKSMPQFEDETFEEIRCENIIEHIGHKERENTLREWKRILKTGGTLRIICPNITYQVFALVECIKNHHGTEGHWLNAIFGGQEDKWNFHKYGYTPNTLFHYLYSIGFKNCQNISKRIQIDIGEMEIVCQK